MVPNLAPLSPMVRFMRLVLACVSGFACVSKAALAPGEWSRTELSAWDRAGLIVQNLSFSEKMLFLHGNPSGQMSCAADPSCAYVGNVASLSRLGLPPLHMNDGPQGIRDDRHPATSTAFPCGMAMAATWDRKLARRWGEALGQEARAKGANVLLGPGVNLARVPVSGRNFEYISGEDPILGRELAREEVRGIQSRKVIATVKHWVLNEQETSRGSASSEVDERTRFEMYYPPFEGAMEAGVGSVMCSYNRVAGFYSCENSDFLNGDLKGALGFQGFVVTDWGAIHSTAIMSGLDMEQPGFGFFRDDVVGPALRTGSITLAAVNNSVQRVISSILSVGVADEPAAVWNWTRLSRNVTTPESSGAARSFSAESTVLLRNERGALPLSRWGHLAVIGLADSRAIIGGYGSGGVVPSYVVTPLQGIREAAAPEAKVEFADGTNLDEATSLASAADCVVVFVGLASSEGYDRSSLSLNEDPKLGDQNELIAEIAKVNPKTIVVASVAGAILMPWRNEVAAILINFLPGQEAGHAIADVLFGVVNPSARLPVTFPNIDNETEFSPAQYPGVPSPNAPLYVFYLERLLVGYRYYDAMGLKFPLGFPFGHGLSYTSFYYCDLAITVDFTSSSFFFSSSSSVAPHAVHVSFSVTNSGGTPGAEVAQLYLGFPASAGEPPRLLKNFEKTPVLQVQEKWPVRLQLRTRDLSVWDVTRRNWTLVAGEFGVFVGASSRDIRLSGAFTVPDNPAQPLRT